MILLSETADGRWVPSIGDPTALGFFTVFVYLVAAYHCYDAFRVAAWSASPDRHARFPIFAWAALAALMLLLAFNKQLDLQSLLTVTARRMARQDGWYARRHELQILFVIGSAVLGGLLLVLLGWLSRRHLRELWLAGCGAVFVVVFILMRMSSFHHVDLFLRSGDVRMNWVLELSGTACIALGAQRAAAWRRARGPAEGSPGARQAGPAQPKEASDPHGPTQ